MADSRSLTVRSGMRKGVCSTVILFWDDSLTSIAAEKEVKGSTVGSLCGGREARDVAGGVASFYNMATR